MGKKSNTILMIVTGALTLGCATSKDFSHKSKTTTTKADMSAVHIANDEYFVNEPPMPYGLKGESIYLLETSPSERNGVYRKPGYRPYVVVTQEHTTINRVERPWAVYFEFNSARIGSVGAVQDMVAYLNRNPSQKIAIVGYTDSYGKEKVNRSLAKRRAVSVRSALLSLGLKNGHQIVRLDAEPESHYLTPNDKSKYLAARNRRAEVVLVE